MTETLSGPSPPPKEPSWEESRSRCSLWFLSPFREDDTVDDVERVWGVVAKTWTRVLPGARGLGSGFFLFSFLFLLRPPSLFFFFLICVIEMSYHRSVVLF